MGQKGQAMLGPTLGAPLLHNLSISILKHIPNPTPPFKNHNLQAGGLGAESLGKCTGSVLLSSPCFSPVFFFLHNHPLSSPTATLHSIIQRSCPDLSAPLPSSSRAGQARASRRPQGCEPPARPSARHKSSLKTESLISVQS